MKPIAMRCSLEQLIKIMATLVENNITVNCCSDFNEFPYLVNNQNGDLGIISNASKMDLFNREIFEEWDANKFLEYCDIKPNRLISFNSIKRAIIRVIKNIV